MIRLSRHAVRRFSGRIEPLPEDDPIKAEMMVIAELFSAKPKHFERVQRRKKRTYMIPTSRAIFVCEHGRSIVTVLKRPEVIA